MFGSPPGLSYCESSEWLNSPMMSTAPSAVAPLTSSPRSPSTGATGATVLANSCGSVLTALSESSPPALVRPDGRLSFLVATARGRAALPLPGDAVSGFEDDAVELNPLAEEKTCD